MPLRSPALAVSILSAALLNGAPAGALPDEVAPAVIGEVGPTTLYLQAATVDTARPATASDLADLIDKGTARTGHWVLQLDGPMHPAWRDGLAAAGVEIGDYLPINAFIVRLAGADAAQVRGLEFVRWFSPYRAEWKLAPGIGGLAYASDERRALRAAGNVVVIITLFRGQQPDGALAAINSFKGAEVHWVIDLGGCATISATISVGDAPVLASVESVQFIEDAPEITPRNDTDRWIVQSNVPGSFPLYDAGLHGEGQVLGLLDTHLDANHCSFSDPGHPIGPLHRKILAYNTSFAAEFHGTHVCGTAVGDSGDQTARRGVAYLGKVVYNGIPSFTEIDVNNRLSTHHMQGARVHTNSWGDDSTTQYNSLCRGFDLFNYNNEDDLVCLAVTNLPTLKNPENAKNLLAVGASQDAPNQGNFCSGGSGPTSDGRRKPEIYAPGCGTNSAASGTPCSLTTATGTSMATPAVAGAGMLVRQYFTDGFYPTGASVPSDSFTPSGALVKATLLNSAVDMSGPAGYPSNQEGWGRVLVGDSLFFTGDARRLVIHDLRNADGFSTGGTVEWPVTVASAALKLKITLVWTDPPAAAGAAFAPINDLDLEVIDPASSLYRGNVFSAGRSVIGGNRDDRNNVEQVQLDSPAPGTWTVRVRATAVNQGTQGYALVVTGDVSETAPCACDWNASGTLDSQDFFDFLSGFFAGNGDFNGAGGTTSEDFFDFLACFFAGCP